MVKNPPVMQETWVRSLGQEDPLEKEMAIHSSILTWRLPWTEKPGGLQSTGSQRVGHDWVTNTAHLELSLIYLGFRKLVKHLSFSHPWWSELQPNSQKRKKKREGGAQWAFLGPLPSFRPLAYWRATFCQGFPEVSLCYSAEREPRLWSSSEAGVKAHFLSEGSQAVKRSFHSPFIWARAGHWAFWEGCAKALVPSFRAEEAPQESLSLHKGGGHTALPGWGTIAAQVPGPCPHHLLSPSPGVASMVWDEMVSTTAP